MHTTAKARRRTIAAARTANTHTQYAALNGWLQAALNRSQIIRTGDMLTRLGITLPDGQQSWYGRHVKTAHRNATGTNPIRVWAQHRTSGRWIQVHAYTPDNPALTAALWSYKATRPYAAELFSEVA